MKKHNFSAGPSILAPEVFEKASRALLDFEGTSLSVAEISHRSAEFVRVIERACSLALEIAGLDDTYTALFLQGGASMQFLMVPYNLLERKAAYVDTGTWANKAHKEATLFGEAIVVASSKAEGYKYIPKEINVPTEVDYLHITTNNTISIWIAKISSYCVPFSDSQVIGKMRSIRKLPKTIKICFTTCSIV